MLESACAETVHWDFGDGTTSDQRTVTHYFGPGDHTVTLTVYNSVGENTKEFHITVDGEDGGSDLPIVLIVATILIVVIVSLVVARSVM